MADIQKSAVRYVLEEIGGTGKLLPETCDLDRRGNERAEAY
jgi:hypothetical protein